ncbi:MAG: glycosyltransferase family 39 protein [Planctomycetes bacterium]|nr:glycosyltransferase family 39 protein [Planctomycetota bacterium]MCB9919839.1 glycosyltransferase family 39 protein [Planctomycetota bacterium]
MYVGNDTWKWRDEAIAIVTIVLVSIALIIRGYGTWCDPIVDYGREVYTPWRLLEGDALGRDIAWFNGPLSQYLNTGVFWLFGTSIRSLTIFNLAIAIFVSLLLYRLARELTSRFAATCGVIAFVVLCAYGQHEAIANFNFACPYSHELTHGVALGLATIYFAVRWLENGRLGSLALAGSTLGLDFLTKPETFLATAAAAGATLVIARRERRGFAVNIAVLLISCAIPVALVWSALAWQSGADNATSLVTGAWKHVTNPDLSGLLFYKSSLGIDDPATRLIILIVSTAAWLAVLFVAVALGRLAAQRPSWTRPAAITGVACCVAFSLIPVSSVDYQDWFAVAFTPLPLVCIVVLTILTRAWLARRLDGTRVVLWVFALVLLAKLGLNSRLHHYGFALAAPALVWIVAASLETLPLWLTKRHVSMAVSRSTILGFWIALGVIGLRLDAYYRSEKTVPMGFGGDRFYAREVGAFINMVLDPLQSTPPDAKLLVLPEGIMFNYLTRRRTPTRVINFMPPEFVMFGETSILEDLTQTPPDVVIVHTRLTKEYGLPLFGRDYARGVIAWLRDQYAVDPRHSVGPDPLDPERVEDEFVGFRVWMPRPR